MMTKHPSVNVLVTGLGPYPGGNGETIDPNISQVLTTLLPRHLAANTALNPSANHINIITLGYPIRTEYGFIRSFCRAIHATELNEHQTTEDDRFITQMLQDIDVAELDLIIHLGEARGWQFMSIERMAFKEGFSSSWSGLPPYRSYYEDPDNRGQTIHDLGPSPWSNVPVGLQSALDIDAVAEGANAVLKNRARYAGSLVTSPEQTKTASTIGADDLTTIALVSPATRIHAAVQPRQDDAESSGSNDFLLSKPIDIKPHREGGHYCCGFTNYESLANCYVNKRASNVLFCHIPGLEDEKSLLWQKDGVLAVVVSAVNQVTRHRL